MTNDKRLDRINTDVKDEKQKTDTNFTY